MENGQREGGKHGETPQSTPAHKRNLSGGLLSLSRLPFLRSSDDGTTTTPVRTAEDPPKHERALAVAIVTKKNRKRKGSLRKAALLGTGKLRQENSNSGTTDMDTTSNLQRSISPPTDDAPDSEQLSWSLPPPANTLTLATSHSPPSTNASPVTSPQSYASTTDDDDGITFAASSLTAAATSLSLMRRRSSRSVPSTLPLPSSKTLPIEHDYSETEWWGWIILLVTWLVFTIGMGSVLGVWSWAWDVGETPYAPPELEDDATLPIVGYYPALIILTGVMAWVWVVVAWVGMKYFRHARFVDGEE
ncbi:hypothetical protein BLS_004736 [Venturia inaequalis]|uniref:Uncharacterized protein n=1 Tax=Venturia inaequalis TaxID=5025 RepID=A0A8H3U5G2_VENIN|nr:hypothetical protein EG328_011456 [Venturia inaequalis]KAE9970855.1 hypothetical protein BLS_004736 [Venturia inaequalis]KAE9988724.1 hypothetical protein EG327_003245 [Venturia inaequalis]RDI88948.1 hypothetical protein Vi05172_g997 [Venturia inaequalis]